MKRLCILTLAILCLGVNTHIYAEIRNGYDYEIEKTEKWLRQLQEIANGPLNELESEKMENRLEAAHALIDNLRENHAKTQEIIDLFKLAAPALYDEMHTLQDCEGNETHIYVNVVNQLGRGLHAATNVDSSDENPNIYRSEYGDHTVSVKIAHVNTQSDLWSLVHELGHVRYQVPHLAEYATFYKKVY